MIALIRIKGQVKVGVEITETLSRMRMRKKYTCVIMDEKKPEVKGMVQKIRNFVAYGDIDEKTLAEMIKARGKVIGKKGAKVENPEKIAKEVMAGKSLEDFGVKPFFGLHPARGGIDSKHHYPEGVLGNQGKEINKMIARML